ncbi:hypothetical protein EIN_373740 [Entamoeba invadens IP1]|uniref:Uncharacterized protein n=1 Tax=Entamoeba invadens IP1 TaxID=370355 RepID=A0A0A1TU33_ENTIV|nr:hypothetical protein EIN_373740 [Entamoeba invadens IP1]ELP83399.1 hypothetical protein EIN_373740 [Entamoeba invadens IP1]|eukprot:XP_004182745.1 hypothetical protein EIN_373740 [Entamoeba invadens IP1]
MTDTDTETLYKCINQLEEINKQLVTERDQLKHELELLRSSEGVESLNVQLDILRLENMQLKTSQPQEQQQHSLKNPQDTSYFRYEVIQDFLYRSLKNSLETQIEEMTVTLKTIYHPSQVQQNSHFSEILSDKRTKLQILDGFQKKNRKRLIVPTISSNQTSKNEKDEKYALVFGILNALKMANVRYELVDIKPEDLLAILETENIGCELWAQRIQLELANQVRY